MESNQRPNRSDMHLSREEETRIEEETRHQFEEAAPKRHTKPSRSEYSQSYLDTNRNSDGIPEYAEFRRLENDPGQHKLVGNGEGQVDEEFVETDYYKDLNCVDKQHHTTGTGFIKLEDVKNASPHYNMEGDAAAAATHDHSYHGNPATNDWIPAAENAEATPASDKPNRSDN